MPKHRTLEIYAAIKRTNRKAAREYLEMAEYREQIDEDAAKAVAGIKDLKDAEI